MLEGQAFRLSFAVRVARGLPTSCRGLYSAQVAVWPLSGAALVILPTKHEANHPLE